MLYYTLIYPFLSYLVITWGNTYTTTLKPLFILKKKAVRLVTFSDFRAHSTPLFYKLRFLKFPDIIFLNNALFMYDFHSGNWPLVFQTFFTSVNKIHGYNTRLACKNSYYLPKIRTNYGKFNIRFLGIKSGIQLRRNTRQSSDLISRSFLLTLCWKNIIFNL